ncbi:MAG: acyl dehydratase [Proteobacteria bacterium]|nr:acyl dehydratase [Pseudomonadota bacterium]
MDWTAQRRWCDVKEDELLTPVVFPLTVYRLVMAAGANRDFNAIHHNTEHARSTGAPEMFANVMLLQGMWERAVREFIGTGGTLHAIRGFRMKAFNTAGMTVTVRGKVERKWIDPHAAEGQRHRLDLRVWSTTGDGISVGPGVVVASLPE